MNEQANRDGFINLNKDKGQSSHQCVAALHRLLQCKAGHCGTLDPDASGVLPVALGKATRLSEYVVGNEKRYLGEICFGSATDSYDAAGTRTQQKDASFVTAAQIEAVLPQFTGRIMQAPPPISALKQGGEALYKKVRRGEEVVVAPRPVEIHTLRLLSFTADAESPCCQIEVCCGQGVYIRSLAHDIGQALGTCAHLRSLQRTQVGQFQIAESFRFEEIAALVEQGKDTYWIPMREALAQVPTFVVPAHALRLLIHGNDARITAAEAGSLAEAPLLQIVDAAGTLLGVGRIRQEGADFWVQMDKVLLDLETYTGASSQPPLVCAIGTFDGLHLGHRALMEALFAKKMLYGGRSAVLTFSPHPLQLIRGSAPALLADAAWKESLLQDYLAVDETIALPFDQALMQLSPEEFVDRVIVPLAPRELVVGYNFTFAAGGKGDAAVLRELCLQRNIKVCIVPEVQGSYGTISSSNIRQQLQQGQLDAANDMLGYWFNQSGEVQLGNQLGRTIGFPTANIMPEEGQIVLPYGVYAGRIVVADSCYDGVINFGVKPTIGSGIKPLVEAHLLDDEMDLYGTRIRVFFGKFLRPEQHFPDINALQAQIAADSVAAKEFLSEILPDQHLPKRLG